jgi:SNF2 family DNA or RNA helicase
MQPIQTTTALMLHQLPAVAKMLPTRAGALFMDMGTGKSRCTIELAAIRQEKYDRLFWFCPAALKATIAQEWRKHTALPDSAICVWGDQVSGRRLPTAARIHIIGIEAMSQSARTILAYKALVTERSFVVVDESSYIKGHASKRTERITALSATARYRLVLTGTPFTQGVIDLFAQMRFLSSAILGYSSFYSFAANHLEYEQRRDNEGRTRRTQRIVRAHNVDYLAAKMAPYVYQVKKEECLDLPAKLYETRYCHMSDEQWAAYNQAKQEILLETEYEDWDSTLIYRLFTALQSILCGFWTRTDPATGHRQRLTFPHERLDVLLHTVRSIPDAEQVIIWAKYHHAVQEIVRALREDYGDAAVTEFHGAIPERRRAEGLAAWQAGHSRFLVATQGVGGHGFTFTNAAYAIFYADGFKYSERIQAEDRQHRMGQTRKVTYITLCCLNSIDERIQDALARKQNALTAFQHHVNRYRKDGLKQQAIQLIKEL